ncbi:MAG: hypothetical protein ABIJ61_12770, partial [bacterium]
EKVWWDTKVGGGEDFDSVIVPAIRSSYAFILCASKQLMERKETNVWPELYEAILSQRKRFPDSVFILPVKLSSCKLPSIPINSHTNLDSLRCIDLFPRSIRAEAILDLVKAIQSSPLHPRHAVPDKSAP